LVGPTRIGSLEPGKLADLALWRVDGLGHTGITDPFAALVFGAAPPLELLSVAAGSWWSATSCVRGRASLAPTCAGPAPRSRGLAMTSAAEVTSRSGQAEWATARPADGTLKVRGEFAYSSDLWLDDPLFGAPCARRTRATHHRHPTPRRPRRARCARHTDALGRARPQVLRTGPLRPAGARHRRDPLPGRAGRHPGPYGSAHGSAARSSASGVLWGA